MKGSEMPDLKKVLKSVCQGTIHDAREQALLFLLRKPTEIFLTFAETISGQEHPGTSRNIQE
jgi:hypothetical protein